MAATGSHPCYEDLPPGAVSDRRRAGLRGQQFPHHSRWLLSTPNPPNLQWGQVRVLAPCPLLTWVSDSLGRGKGMEPF